MKRRTFMLATTSSGILTLLPRAIADFFEEACARIDDELVCEIPDEYAFPGCETGYDPETNTFGCLVENFPGLMVMNDSWIWGPGWAGLRLIHKSGTAMVGPKDDKRPYPYDFYVQFRQIGLNTWGRPVYMQKGHADGQIFLVGGYPPASYNGGVELWVTNSELPLLEAALSPNQIFEKDIYFGESVEVDFKALREEADALFDELEQLKKSDVEQYGVENVFNETLNEGINNDWWSRRGYKFELADRSTLKENVEKQVLAMLGGDEPLEAPQSDEKYDADYFKEILDWAAEFIGCNVQTGQCRPATEVIEKWAADLIAWIFETFEHVVIGSLEFIGVTTNEAQLIDENLAAGMDENEAQIEAFRQASVNKLFHDLGPDIVLTVFPFGVLGNLFKGGLRLISKVRTPVIRSIVSVRYVKEADESTELLNDLVRHADEIRDEVYELAKELAHDWDEAKKIGGVYRTVLEAVSKGKDTGKIIPQAEVELAAMQERVKDYHIHILELFREVKEARRDAWFAQQEASKFAFRIDLPDPFAGAKDWRGFFSELRVKEGKDWAQVELEDFVQMNVSKQEFKAMQEAYQDALEYLPKDHAMIKISGIHEGGRLFALLESRKQMRDQFFWARVSRGQAMEAADEAHKAWLKVQSELNKLRTDWRAAKTVELREKIKQAGLAKAQEALQLAKQEQEAKTLIPFFHGQVKELNQRISHLNEQIVVLGDTPLWGGKPLTEATSNDWWAYHYPP